jgi:4-amino-4-deoxy-L-arabinose transferase-like glycosyltransferase
MKGNQQKLFYILIGLIALVNCLQAAFTELIYDEAYYWYFSSQLDWGYFDHPPMVAGMMALGNLVFKGTLAVRIIGVLMSVGTYILLWETIKDPRKYSFVWSFIVLVFSMTLLNAYGFFSLPDTPLLFFTALFIFLLQAFYNKANWILSLALGLVMAALMYSKYHAVLVIVGVVFGNPKLLKNRYAWGSVLVSLLAYSPHLYWLYKNEFVSVAYHLFERPNRAYDFFDFGLGYWVNLIAIFGLTFPFIYKTLFSVKANTSLKKSMIGIVLTVLVFFLVSSFNRRIQTQWIVVICIPVAYLVFERLIEDKKLRKQLWVSGLINIVLIVFLRLGLIFEPLLPISYEAHGNKKWVAALEKKVGLAKVVFEDSYRNAPMYAFYSRATTYSLNSISYRENQYNIDGSEESIQGEKVAYITKEDIQSDFSFQKAKNTVYYGRWIDHFQSYSLLETKLLEISAGVIYFKLTNPYKNTIALQDLDFGVAFLNSYKQYKNLTPIYFSKEEEKEMNTKRLAPGASILIKGAVKKPTSYDESGYFKITIASAGLPYLLGGTNQKIARWKPF